MLVHGKSVMLYTSTYGKTNTFGKKQKKSQAQELLRSHAFDQAHRPFQPNYLRAPTACLIQSRFAVHPKLAEHILGNIELTIPV